ncbi:hypothetical protein D3C72_1836000 [compost metagenome]
MRRGAQPQHLRRQPHKAVVLVLRNVLEGYVDRHCHLRVWTGAAAKRPMHCYGYTRRFQWLVCTCTDTFMVNAAAAPCSHRTGEADS